jgi:hypothetical protein
MSDAVKRLEKHVPLKATQVRQGLYGATSKLPDALEKAAMARGKNPDFSGASDVTYPLAEPSDMAKKRIKEGMERISDVADEYQRESTRGIKKMKSGGKVSSASSRADGCAIKGKTKGRMI